jgi:type III pantothenate kinase
MDNLILCIDIGNTNTTIAIYSNNQFIKTFRISSFFKTSDELAAAVITLLNNAGFVLSHINAVIICSVIPEMNLIWSDFTRNYINIEPFIIKNNTIKNIKNLYNEPEKLGIDRLVNVFYAWSKYKTNTLVIDFGTATTFDCVTEQAEFMGGLIIPGIKLMFDSLYEKTSLLPLANLNQTPETCLCRDTEHAISNGIMLGYADMTNGLILRIKKEMPAPLKIIATGGLGGIMANHCPVIEEYIPDLTIEGIYLVYKTYFV